jgi:hypothetical protein
MQLSECLSAVHVMMCHHAQEAPVKSLVGVYRLQFNPRWGGFEARSGRDHGCFGRISLREQEPTTVMHDQPEGAGTYNAPERQVINDSGTCAADAGSCLHKATAASQSGSTPHNASRPPPHTPAASTGTRWHQQPTALPQPPAWQEPKP